MCDCFDFVITGSGPAAAMAAQTLIEAGKQVLILDVGINDGINQNPVPYNNFLELRKTDELQHQYFLGNSFESIIDEDIKPAAQLTPPRQYMIKKITELTPIQSDTFSPVESLAYGGLGVSWGLGCYVYSDAELRKCALPNIEMRKAYQKVSERIGISSSDGSLKDQIQQDLDNLLPPLIPDNATKLILSRAERKHLFKQGFHFGKPSMAILTEPLNDRKATAYHDMDFYTDHGESCWRPQFTIDKLKLSDKLHYIPNQLVLSFEQNNEHLAIQTLDIISHKRNTFLASRLLLGAGALGNARILLRSNTKIKQLPFLCNPYVYMPCFQPSMLGKPLSAQKTSMAQAMMIYDPDNTRAELVSVAFYTYRSLLLNRLASMVPAGYSHARRLLKYLQSSFIIAGIHHPDNPSRNKYISLAATGNSPTSDCLKASYSLNKEETRIHFFREKKIRKALSKAGCFPIKRIDPGFGGSIHYGGTIPFSEIPSIITQKHNGSLHSHPAVFILDASGFNFLPAKGVTLSIMANAHRVAIHALNSQ